MGRRYSNIDAIKCIAAFLVVTVHSHFPGLFGEIFLPISYLGVPLFLMVSGYFFKPDKALMWVKKVFLMAVICSLLYLLTWTPYFIAPITIKSVARFIVLGTPLVCEPLWYLWALIPALPIMRILVKKVSLNRLLLIGAVLFFIGVLISMTPKPGDYHRNFLFTSLPYLILGYYIRNGKRIAISNYILTGAAIIAGMPLMGGQIKIYMILCSIVTPLFLYRCFYWITHSANIRVNVISKIGERYSMLIYLVHPYILYRMQIWSDARGFVEEYRHWIEAPLCFAITLVIVMVCKTAYEKAFGVYKLNRSLKNA